MRTGKSWQGNTPMLVIQLSSIPRQFADRGKGYLIADVSGKNPNITFCVDKPQNLQSNGGFASLFRKHLPQTRLVNILRMEDSGDLWVYMELSPEKQSRHWALKLSSTTPPNLDLMDLDQKISHMRLSKDGLYTRKKDLVDYHPPESLDSVKSLLPSIFDIKNAIEQRVNYQGEEILELSQHQRSIRDKLSRRLKTLKKSYEKLSHQTPTKQSWQRLADDAQLLQTHLHLVKPDNYVLTLTPEQTGLDQDLCLMIDPEKSPGQNLNDRFLEIKKKKRSLDIGSKRLTLLAKDIALADEDLARLRHQILDDTELAEFVRRHSFLDGKQIQSPKQTQGDRLAYRAYKDQNGVIYRVGKGSSDNDVLTKSAKANDFWLHVVGSPGSHIIIPAASLPQKELSSDAKKTAAILAIHYSKRRSDHAGEVYVTQRRFLRKPKQAPTGMWTVDKSESIFVRYDETELKQILDTLSSL